MTEDEVETVAAELAKAGGHSWYPGRERGPFKVVADRYRDRARLAIAALDRLRTSRQPSLNGDGVQKLTGSISPHDDAPIPSADKLTVGTTVLYRPPGDQRFYRCRIEKIEGRQAYLVPDIKICTGWVDIENFLPATSEESHTS